MYMYIYIYVSYYQPLGELISDLHDRPERMLAKVRPSSRRPRRYLCGSPPVASATRRRARQTAPG